MINFSCRCGEKFSVPADLAGNPLQCPQCHLLVEVPLLSELESIEADGTLKLGEVPEKPESDAERIRKLRHIYHPGRQDDDGVDIDLRADDETLRNAGVVEIPLGSTDGLIPMPPRYDPDTGEVIKPLDLKPEEARPLAAIPVAAPALNYATPDTPLEAPPASLWRMVFRPASLVVMGVILLVHLLLPAARYFPLFYVFFYFLFVFQFAHYALVVEETGPGECDELPAFLRGNGLGDDFFRPTLHSVGSLLLCYLPLGFFDKKPFALMWLAIATTAFPAVFLTTCGSGLLGDLRPDRIVGVIINSGWRYLVSLLLWVSALAAYAAGLAGAISPRWLSSLFPPGPAADLARNSGFVLLAAGIVLLHMFCVQLGLLYRVRHTYFPWVLQEQHRAAERVKRRRRQRPNRLLYARPEPRTPPPAAAAPVPATPVEELPPLPRTPPLPPLAPRPQGHAAPPDIRAGPNSAYNPPA
jgi:hypothetical protein